MSVKNLSVMISGANQGFGLAVAESFIKEGARVSLCARDLSKLEEARAALKRIKPDAEIIITRVDITDQKEVKAWTEQTLQSFGQIDVLIANAGIYGPKGAIEDISYEAWSEAIDINLKGIFLQIQSVVPHFKSKKAGRVIVLSGGGATKPMPLITAYAASKAGAVRLAESLAEELKPYDIYINSIAPGALNTRLLQEVLEAGPEKVGQDFYQQALKQRDSGGANLELGAALCLYLAITKTKVTGKLISAVWDPWRSFEEHVDDLNHSDIYTLRRIIPKERGMSWGEK